MKDTKYKGVNDMYDVIVVGGGISGSIAAIAASRCGAKTLLIEQHGFLGGTLTACGVGPMMTFHVGDKQVVQGITGEVIERLEIKGKSPGHIFDTTGTTYTVTPFDAEAMKSELENMLIESDGEILYHTMLADVAVGDGRIHSIKVCNKAGLTDIYGKTFIDATGDADLSKWAGVECRLGRRGDQACQPMTLKIRMNNVDIEKLKDTIRTQLDEFPRYDSSNVNMIDRAPRLSTGGFVKILKKAEENGSVSFDREEILIFETNNKGEVIINTTRIQGVVGTDPYSLSKAEIEGRKQADEIVKLLTSQVPGFEEANLMYTGPNIGVRSSRHIKGQYTLKIEALLSGKKFDDVIAHGGYPIDIHPPEGEDGDKDNDEAREKRHLEWGKMYSIPYRTLVNNQINNLITVGRCISVDFEAQGGIRVTPIAGAIGHAGGVGAYLATVNEVSMSEVKISEIHKILLEQGAYLNI